MKPRSASLLFLAFERAAVAWHQADAQTRGELNEHTRNALDAADAIRELRELAAYGGAEALAVVARDARALVERARKTARLRSKSDSGVVLVQWARQGLADRESSQWIAEKLAQSLSDETSRALGLRRQSWGAYRAPSLALIAAAAKAIEKHRGSRASLTDRDPDRIARVCAQHALEAFGLSTPKAKIVAGLRTVPLDQRKRV